MLQGIHHIAIIFSDYERSKKFYAEILKLKIISENFRTGKNSYKLDLAVNGEYKIVFFSFPSSPPRVSCPKATGLRHLAFSVNDLEKVISKLNQYAIITDPLRTDEFTGNRFTFFADLDGLPIELYEIK